MKGLDIREMGVKTNLFGQNRYDQFRPQSGKCFGALESFRDKYRRNCREGNGGTGDLSERRGCASSANAFLESTTPGSRKARRTGRISGETAQAVLNAHCRGITLKLSSGLLVIVTAFLSGCAHKQTPVSVPPPPSISEQKPGVPAETSKQNEESAGKIEVPPHAKPIFEQTGMASWYGAPYHNRRGSNGEVYDMNAMTAAHLTLPLGSIARVTNLKTGHSALVRITDRGPFVEGRILDLSLAAAKALDVYLPGTAEVRLEVLETPASLDSGGRWAVQIGSFHEERNAAELAAHLQRRYLTAKVVKFASPTGDWWVRVRVTDDDRQRAQSVIREMQASAAPAFLVRLD